ncbi:biliverdin-producing heme oxygenase [Rhodopseudomonas boonkerdii]|uniref:biliverdin-producing heme oxygenase n=1 Tax=Rhodopseudomonas boonkerdii TaxID=475937 RepID=UPI001E3AA80F|nr:biliverdin-producing heme oxygenase [Rhodopseudomonas boonkerdii]UGV27726.1 biliverdin-producing heme oxygenase [Rhodopseudomonas boonkerdii]
MTTPPPTSPASVVTDLYRATKTLHTEAERSGIIRDMLRGEASRDGYILLQRNLLPAYQALEAGLASHRDTPLLGALAAYRLDRAAALEADLDALCGGDVSQVPVLPEGNAYAQRIAEAATGDGERLIAHAYTRYLGDLSGGQILKKLLAKKPGLAPNELTFYDFPAYADLAALKSDYRNALDDAGKRAAQPQAIVDEGSVAFQLNTDISWAVQAAMEGVKVG